jgi:hypothetical protein
MAIELAQASGKEKVSGSKKHEMEQQPHGRREEVRPAPEVEESPEAVRIRESIAEALRDGSTIDDETAYLIARAITPGSGVLHQLALTGEVSPEIGGDLEAAYELLSDLADTWIAALDGFCYRRRVKGPIQEAPGTQVI